MKAVVYTQYGSPDVLTLSEIEQPSLNDDQVLVKVHATSVTTGDVNVRNFVFVANGFKTISRLMFGYNKPKKTPNHPTKSHVVVAKVGDKTKIIRFGQQGVKGAGKNPKTKKDKARRKSYYARHNAQDF